MKEIKELKFEELTVRQKLGMVFTPLLNRVNPSQEDEDLIFQLIRERALGAVWIQQNFRTPEFYIKKVKELADYPIIIMTDAESGIQTATEKYFVGSHRAISNTGDVKRAYIFGKVLGAVASKMGYNMLCNPVVDIESGGVRSLGEDKELVAEYAVSIAKGLHDGGVLSLAKHYPGAEKSDVTDSHMAESVSYMTKDELIQKSLYPYRKLMEEDLLDGIMVGHERIVNIDDMYPASLSKDVVNVIRDLGFDGFSITDGFGMMGIKARFGDAEAAGLAISAGNNILPFSQSKKAMFDDLSLAYEQGMIDKKALDNAVKRVLKLQHKVMMLNKASEITDEELKLFKDIDKDGVYARTDKDMSVCIPRDGKHFFAILTDNEVKYKEDGTIDLDTFSSDWYNPCLIEARLKELFPNCKTGFIQEYPSPWQNWCILNDSLGYDSVIFVTYTDFQAFQGLECFTKRFVCLINAMQKTKRVSTFLHFGNAKILEDLPHIPRIILGGKSENGVMAGIDVLAGKYPAKGILTSNVDFK